MLVAEKPAPILVRTDAENCLPSEVADYLVQVFLDGRFVDEALTNPSRVAAKLGISLSEEARVRVGQIPSLREAASGALQQLEDERPHVRNFLAVAVIVITAPGIKSKEEVLDTSGERKF